jgi:sugar phosphate isomerase/epimerase
VTGILKSSIPGFQSLDTPGALAKTANYGLSATVFSGLQQLSATLDPGELSAVRDLAAEKGLSIGTSIEWINPLTERGRVNAAFGGGDLLAGLTRLVKAAHAIGIDDAFFMVGKIEDRFDPDISWGAQLDATRDILKRLAPVLRDLGAKVLVKTHEEITTFEIVRLVEAVGADVLGVALDPVNLLCRIEDPVEATRRVAPYVAQVHVDDAVLRFEGGEMRRYLCPLGEGAVDWRSILPLVPKAKRLLEFHSGQFAMPVFDPSWRRAQPDLTLDEYASVLSAAANLPQDYVPSDQADSTSRLPAALEALKSLPP